MTIPSTTDDLIAEIEAAAKVATPGPHHIYTNQRDDNNWKANAEFHAKCQPQTVLALTARVRELEGAQRWISVAQQVPENGRAFDAWHKAGYRDLDQCYLGSKGESFKRLVMEHEGFTHWMYSPEPPQ